jgi:hypothetical protein
VMQDMTEHTIEMLHSYRKHCAASSSPGQLILPDSLKLLPLYLAVIGKLCAFNTNKLVDTKARPGAPPRPPFADVAVRADARMAQLELLNGLPANRIVPFLYPRLFALHSMCGLVGNGPTLMRGSLCREISLFLFCVQYGTPLENEDDLKLLHWEPSESQPSPPHRDPAPHPLAPSQLSSVVLPRTTYPSGERVESGGVFLLEHAEGLFVHVGLDADEQARSRFVFSYSPPHAKILFMFLLRRSSPLFLARHMWQLHCFPKAFLSRVSQPTSRCAHGLPSTHCALTAALS